MNNQNFYRALHEGGLARDKAPFLTLPCERCWTYDEIAQLTAKIAGALSKTGARPGDRIAVQVEKSAENIALYLAALRLGLVYTPLNTAYTGDEIDYFLKDSEPAVFVSTPGCENAGAKAGIANIFTLDATGGGSLMDAQTDAAPFEEIAVRHDDDLAAIVYTSGTTGRSKGAMLSHHNLATNALALHRLWGFRPGDVLLHALPVFHVHGLFVALHTAMLNGSEIIFLRQFDTSAVRAALPDASVMMGVPTFYTRLLAEKDFSKQECAHMRLFISGSAPLMKETHEAFEKRTGFSILERYGMSETGMIASNPLDGARLPGTVGYALPDIELRITDDKGALLPPNEPGSVEVKGPNVFKGYWRMPEKTRQAFRAEGWFVTGDIGAVSEDGRLTLAGRAKDLIIAGGYNIYPKEIELVLDAVPGILESAVIGVPHPDMGEGVVAILVVEAGADLADDILKNALSSLARFKQPRHFIQVDALPRNAMGKVRKQILRETYSDIFNKV